MNKKYLFISIIILVYIIGVLAFPDIFFDRECYRFNPAGEKFRINCSDLVIENKSYSDSIFKYKAESEDSAYKQIAKNDLHYPNKE